MTIQRLFLPALLIAAFLNSPGYGDLTVGTLSDFQTGTAEGWGGGTITILPNGGPLGAGDFALQLANGGGAGRFSMRNNSFSGVIDPGVTGITVDIFRASGLAADGEIRMVLHNGVGPVNTRWTSTVSAIIPRDDNWATYFFSIQEVDLTRVFGAGSYNDLLSGFNTLQFRHDPGTPSSNGSPLDGTILFDNFNAVPEPGGITAGLFLAVTLGLRRRR